MSGHPLATSPHLHGLDETFLETSPFLWILAQQDVLSFSLVLYCTFCNVFELLTDVLGSYAYV
jgi:hypothetical protein